MFALDEIEKAVGNEYLNNVKSVELNLTVKQAKNDLEVNTLLISQPCSNKIVHLNH